MKTISRLSRVNNAGNAAGASADAGKQLTAAEILAQVTPTPLIPNHLSRDEKVQIITTHFREIMVALGLDLSDDSLRDTPRRVAKMYVDELFSGLDVNQFPKITAIDNKMGCNDVVTIRDIKVMSSCEHHFVTIDGFANVAYIPKGKVIGLSKINRIVDYFARRPQVQERLTKQIADCLQVILETEDVAVYLQAKHYCVAARGIKDVNSQTTTKDLRGIFMSDRDLRQEFLQQCTR